MSHGDADDMVFGEVSYREPVRMRRPDRDPRRTCIAYHVPAPGDLTIALDRRPADLIERHSLRDTSVELGGILLGKECLDEETGEPFVWISEALEAKHYENTQASFTYTHDSWEEITRERDEQHPDLDIVGWYHTHPDFGVFLSSHDLFIHHNFFAQPLQVAYVVDPIRQTRGFFQWKGGQMVPVRGFYLAADRGDRLALARLVNDLEGLPSTEGGGSGLSPRLEAELIPMLSRPQAPPPAASAQTAAVFSVLGVLLGALIVGMLFWLYALGEGLRDQTAAVTALAEAQAESTERLEGAIAASRLSVKEQALDAALANVQPGVSADGFRRQITDAMSQVQVLEERVSQVETEKLALNSLIRDLRERAESAGRELTEAQTKAEEEHKKLEDQLGEALASRDDLKNTVTRQEGLLSETGAASLANRYNLVFYAAIGGWAVAAVCLAGLIVTMNRRSAEDDEGYDAAVTPGTVRVQVPPAQPAAPRPGEPRPESPPHVIE